MKTVIYCMLGASILVGCGRVVVRTPASDDTYRLDQCRQQAPEFVDSVKKFYRAVQDKDWATSYDMRTATFKQDVTRNYYLEQMAKDNPHLNSYKVLSVQMFGDVSGIDAAELIIEVNHGVSYDCARWKKVEGVWLCDEPGLGGLDGSLRSLRIPDWVPSHAK
jgi:hypothetical protein